MQIFVKGTLGDTYITVCKLSLFKEHINVKHTTAIEEWYTQIRDIYSLLPNINVEFINDSNGSFSSLPKDGNMNWFPEFFTNRCNYGVIQVNSGKPEKYQKNHKLLSEDIIYDYINANYGNFILIGTHSYYEKIKHDKVLNLVNKTSILQAIKIVAESCSFFGPEGLLSFVALSHKVNSIVFYNSYQAVSARIINTPWEKYCKLVEVI